MEKVIHFSEEVDIFLNELMYVLHEKGYYYYEDSAKTYVERMVQYVNTYVGTLTGKDAPPVFNRYGTDLKYITYNPNKATTWYVLYEQNENLFLISYITNNHVAGKYFI